MNNVLERKKFNEQNVSYTPIKKVISIPQKEVKQMDDITKKLMDIHGFSFSQLHRKLLRDEYKRQMLQNL
tara:strand:- start:56 stop:265 length:210 start_codon:yes stop_codon:yes gene_type:complete